MPIRNILSAYSGDAARGSGLRHAVRLARHHEAWLTGVLRHGRHGLAHRAHGLVGTTVLEALREADRERVAEAEKSFYDAAKAGDIEDRAAFIDLDVERHGSLSAFARAFDLIVTGVHSTRADEAHLSANPDTLALQSGRPVLVVPDGYEADALAEHALVAWDGSRAAARAIGDAMDILSEKPRVTVLTVGSKPSMDDVPGGGLIRHLERHGIDAEFVHRDRGRGIAETILSVAEERGARLIVIGAFEHSKFQHDIFGGVTTDVVRDARVPVFMAH